MNEESGVRFDSVANSDLTDGNTVLFIAGQLGNAADFERSNSEYFSIADNTAISFTDEASWCIWHKWESDSVYQTFARKYGTHPDRDYIMSWQSDVGGKGLTFEYYDESQIYRVAISDDAGMSNGIWYFTCWVFDHGTIRFFVDGTQLGSDDVTAGSAINDTTEQLFVGARSATQEHVDGAFDEFSMFDTALSSSTIETLYNGGTPLTYLGLSTGTTTAPYLIMYNDDHMIESVVCITATCTVSYSSTTPFTIDDFGVLFLIFAFSFVGTFLVIRSLT